MPGAHVVCLILQVNYLLTQNEIPEYLQASQTLITETDETDSQSHASSTEAHGKSACSHGKSA